MLAVSGRDARPARVEDVHELAASMPHVVVVTGSRGNPVYQVGGRFFVFFRTRRPDAVDPETGEQRAARPAVVQIQHGKPQVVWPEWLQSSTLQPYPPWSERKLLE